VRRYVASQQEAAVLVLPEEKKLFDIHRRSFPVRPRGAWGSSRSGDIAGLHSRLRG
jgi:hypothetical protein